MGISTDYYGRRDYRRITRAQSGPLRKINEFMVDVRPVVYTFFAYGLVSLEKRNYGSAFILLVIQFALAFFGYGISHYPYLLYPHLTLYDSFTNHAMAISLIVAFILGFCLLVPSLYLLLKLFLFNKQYVSGK